MSDVSDTIDRRLRRARLEAIAPAVTVAALLGLALAALVYSSATPVRHVGDELGHITGMHQEQTELSRGAQYVTVALDNGGTASVALPRGELYRRDARINVLKHQRAWPPRTTHFRFVSYVD